MMMMLIYWSKLATSPEEIQSLTTNQYFLNYSEANLQYSTIFKLDEMKMLTLYACVFFLPLFIMMSCHHQKKSKQVPPQQVSRPPPQRLQRN